jgi:GAF domain-containing protein
VTNPAAQTGVPAPPGARSAVSAPGAAEELVAARAALARATLLAEVTSDLALSLDVAGSLRRLARLVVPVLADWVLVDLADEDGLPVQVAMVHRDGRHDVVARFTELQPAGMTPQAPIMRVLAGAAPILVPHAQTAAADAYVFDSELLELCDELGIVSAMYVPLTARGRVLGSIALISGVSGRIYTEQDLDFAADLGRRAALVVDNASLYEREHHVAHVLQESLLPRLPELARVELAASYLPSTRGADIGGDFYDVLPLPDGATGLAVGDVVGHDIVAAAAMGQLRGLLRACAWELSAGRGGEPADVLTRLDRLVLAFELTPLATVFYARLRPTAAAWSLDYCLAGHPGPLVRTPDGRVRELAGGGVALGVDASVERVGHTATLPVGSVLVAFTDGLIERRGEAWEVGLDRVRAVLEETPPAAPAAVLATRIADTADAGRADDVAVLVARLG